VLYSHPCQAYDVQTEVNMVYRGKTKNNMVVLPENIQLVDGLDVDVLVQDPAPQQEQTPTVWNELLKIAGTVHSGRTDGSKNVDHYLYGLPKRP